MCRECGVQDLSDCGRAGRGQGHHELPTVIILTSPVHPPALLVLYPAADYLLLCFQQAHR